MSLDLLKDTANWAVEKGSIKIHKSAVIDCWAVPQAMSYIIYLSPKLGLAGNKIFLQFLKFFIVNKIVIVPSKLIQLPNLS